MCCSVISSSFFPPNFPQEHLMLMYTSDSCTFKLDDLLSHPIPKVYSRIYWVLDNMLNAAVKQPSCQNHLGRPGRVLAAVGGRRTHTHQPVCPALLCGNTARLTYPAPLLEVLQEPLKASLTNMVPGEKR